MIDKDHQHHRIEWLKPVPHTVSEAKPCCVDYLKSQLLRARRRYPEGCEIHTLLTRILEGSPL